MFEFLKIASSSVIVRGALQVSLVVGALLNLINQWGQLFGPGEPAWGHVVLNFIVPFCVATYSATRNQLRNKSAQSAGGRA